MSLTRMEEEGSQASLSHIGSPEEDAHAAMGEDHDVPDDAPYRENTAMRRAISLTSSLSSVNLRRSSTSPTPPSSRKVLFDMFKHPDNTFSLVPHHDVTYTQVRPSHDGELLRKYGSSARRRINSTAGEVPERRAVIASYYDKADGHGAVGTTQLCLRRSASLPQESTWSPAVPGSPQSMQYDSSGASTPSSVPSSVPSSRKARVHVASRRSIESPAVSSPLSTSSQARAPRSNNSVTPPIVAVFGSDSAAFAETAAGAMADCQGGSRRVDSISLHDYEYARTSPSLAALRVVRASASAEFLHNAHESEGGDDDYDNTEPQPQEDIRQTLVKLYDVQHSSPATAKRIPAQSSDEPVSHARKPFTSLAVQESPVQSPPSTSPIKAAHVGNEESKENAAVGAVDELSYWEQLEKEISGETEEVEEEDHSMRNAAAVGAGAAMVGGMVGAAGMQRTVSSDTLNYDTLSCYVDEEGERFYAAAAPTPVLTRQQSASSVAQPLQQMSQQVPPQQVPPQQLYGQQRQSSNPGTEIRQPRGPYKHQVAGVVQAKTHAQPEYGQQPGMNGMGMPPGYPFPAMFMAMPSPNGGPPQLVPFMFAPPMMGMPQPPSAPNAGPRGNPNTPFDRQSMHSHATVDTFMSNMSNPSNVPMVIMPLPIMPQYGGGMMPPMMQTQPMQMPYNVTTPVPQTVLPQIPEDRLNNTIEIDDRPLSTPNEEVPAKKRFSLRRLSGRKAKPTAVSPAS